MYNKLLQRQIHKHLGEVTHVPEKYVALFKVISESYDHYEKDRKMLERAIDLSSGEMIELNNQLRNDIIELKKAKKEIKDNEANLNAIINNTNDSIFSVDKNYKILSLNDSFRQNIYKLTGRHITSGDCFFIEEAGEERLNAFKNYLERALEGEQFKVEVQDVLEGEILYAEISFNPIMENTEIIGVGCFSRNVTKEKVVTEQLRASEVRFRSLIENSQDMLILIREDGIIEYISPTVERIFGYNNEENKSKTAMELIHPDDRLSMKEHLEEVVDKPGIPISCSFRNRKNDGSFLWVEGSLTNMLHKSGINSVVGHFRDITEEKMVKDRLLKLQANLQTIFTNADTGYVLLDKVFNVIYFNQHAQKFVKNELNNTIEEGMYALDCFSQERREIIRNVLVDVLNGNTVSYEVSYIQSDGSEKWYYAKYFPVSNDQEGVFNIILSLTDFTETKKAAETLKKNERQLREISSSIPGIVYQFKLDSNGGKSFPYMSEGITLLLGITPQEIYDDADQSFKRIHPEDLESFMNSIAVSAKTMQPWLQVFRVGLPEENTCKWIRGNSIPRKLEDGSILWNGTMIDITERKIAELEREKMITDIIQRNKNLEQFSYIVSHNLRAPVANIMGLSLALLDEETEDYLKNDLLDGLYSSATKLDEVILDLNNILQIKHGINERKELVSFSEVSNNVYLSIRSQLKGMNAAVKWDFSEVDRMITLKSYMQSIFYNLIFNSVKYRQPNIPPIIEIRSRKIHNKIELLFSDNCMGIDLKKNGDQVFGLYKRFHDNEAEGKGLGLFMVKTQVEAIGGKIFILSEVNKGTEFKIEFEM